jgi:lipoyl(octanoyl) transferase
VNELRIVRVGTLDYEQAWTMQRELHAARADDAIGDTVLLVEHPSVYTAGRRTRPAERPTDGSRVIDVDRGGKITWHGPGQLVGYPIVRLAEPVDVIAYVRALEAILISVCADVGVDAERVAGRSGVWLREPDRKVAAIGVRIARGVTLHGFALNCNPDLAAYDTIIPCGIEDAGVTSLSVELGHDVSVAAMMPVVEQHLPALVALAAVSQLSARSSG